MKNRFYKYDDNNFWFIITVIVSVVFITITFLLRNIGSLLFIGICLSSISIIGAFLIYNTGVHIRYDKSKILIIDALCLRIIPIDNIRYITFEENDKIRKAKRSLLSPDSLYRAYWTDSSKYVYRQGKTYRIIIYMNDGSIIESYDGWRYNTKSENRVLRQERKLQKVIQEFMLYKISQSTRKEKK
jgi:hypothetical protein